MKKSKSKNVNRGVPDKPFVVDTNDGEQTLDKLVIQQGGIMVMQNPECRIYISQDRELFWGVSEFLPYSLFYQDYWIGWDDEKDRYMPARVLLQHVSPELRDWTKRFMKANKLK